MSLFNRMGNRRNAVIGAAVVGVSLVWAVAPASAATTNSRTTLSTSTPSIGAGTIAKLKAVVRPATGTVPPTGTVTFREGTLATSPVIAVPNNPAPLTTINGLQTAKLDVPGLSIGTHTFIATYSGSGTFNPSTSLTTKIVVTVVPKTNTKTTASGPTETALPGEEVKLKAVVKTDPTSPAKPDGTVTFSEAGTTLGTGPADLDVTGAVSTARLSLFTLSNGSHSIIATYNGSTAYNTSVSTAISVTVGKVAPVCTLTPSATNTTSSKTRFAFKVTPASGTIVPTGTGTWTIDAGTPLAQPNQALVLQYSQPITTGRDSVNPILTNNASHTVTITYDGDTTYASCFKTVTITTPYTPPAM